MSAPPPRPASTVVLLRDDAEGLTVYLVRRHTEVAFMGGAHVFPGGRVEATDADAAYGPLADGHTTATDRFADTDAATALAFCVAAVRETFEEAGVLLARDAEGELICWPQPHADAAAARAAVTSGATTLLDLLREHDWRLALDALVYFAHWVTPPIETRRFDTRFFLAAAPPQQSAAHDAAETTAGLWIRPSDALASCRRGEIALPPPTWTTLRWLEQFERVEAALRWARAKQIPRIEPGFIEHPEGRFVILPGDESMPRVDGFDATETRFLLTAGRWTPVIADGQR